MIALLLTDSHIFLRAVPVMFVGALIAALGIYVLIRGHASRIGIEFWLFSLCISTWLITSGIDYAGFEMSQSLWLHRLSNVSVTYIPATAFALTVTVIQRASRFRMLLWVTIVVSTLFSISVVTTDLFISGLYHYSWGYYSRYGVLSYFFLIFFFGMMLFVIRLYWMEYRRSAGDRHKKRLKGLLLAFSIGCLGAFDFPAAFGIPLYPFGYIPIFIFIVITAYVIMRYRLVDITPELAAGQILETMQGAVIVVDLEGRIRVMNRAAHAILGYYDAALLGKDISSIINLPAELRDYNHVRSQSVPAGETVWIDREERSVDVSLSASAVADRDNVPVGIVYVAHDITERKRAEEKLRHYADELKRSNEDVMSFAYIVSHDLRAPLISIKGFTNELKTGLNEIAVALEKCSTHLDEKERERIAAIHRKDVPVAMEFISSSVVRMDGLINAVLNLSRLGHRDLKPELVDMSAVVRTILNSMAHQIEQRKVKIAIEKLPEIVSDRISMEQIMGNLLDNALKYLDSGRGGEIKVTSEETTGETVFHVRDNGKGIAKEDMNKVFELFRRGGNHDVPGEGMGLAYVKTLVRRHGGRVWCESQQGVGTTFSFTIPRKRDIFD